jgi:hypothetical protein
LSLQRLVLTFKPEGVEVRALYRKKNGPNPGTKARAREVVDLTRSGLQNALRTLEERVEVIGTSGYEIREDTISVDVVRK